VYPISRILDKNQEHIPSMAIFSFIWGCSRLTCLSSRSV